MFDIKERRESGEKEFDIFMDFKRYVYQSIHDKHPKDIWAENNCLGYVSTFIFNNTSIHTCDKFFSDGGDLPVLSSLIGFPLPYLSHKNLFVVSFSKNHYIQAYLHFFINDKPIESPTITRVFFYPEQATSYICFNNLNYIDFTNDKIPATDLNDEEIFLKDILDYGI